MWSELCAWYSYPSSPPAHAHNGKVWVELDSHGHALFQDLVFQSMGRGRGGPHEMYNVQILLANDISDEIMDTPQID